jgi:TonB family protein
VPEAQAFLQRRPLVGQNKVSAPPVDAAATFRTLNQAVAANTYEADLTLGAIAEAAQALTGATAAAVALDQDGAVLCRGRSGEIAPELGARLSVDSGVSGECLRTGKILRCDDTQRDYRADPEVCRRLGLRSIAVVPVRRDHQTIGIVEAFSSRTYAFAEEHMDALRRLAELALTAYERELGIASPVEPVAAVASTEPEFVSPDEGLAALARASVSAAWRALIAKEKRRYLIIGVTAASLTFLVLAGMRFWSRPAAENTAQASAAPATPVPTEVAAPVAGAALVFKPSPGRVEAAKPRVTLSGVQPASAVEKEVVERPKAVAGTSAAVTTDAKTDAVPNATAPLPPPPGPAEVEAPKLMASAQNPASIGSLVSVPASIPRLGYPVSEGVSQGAIIHRIQPVYPIEALPSRLEGNVVLAATITEDGKVKDLKVVSGHPLLARAATDAVSQWRYRPYMLNGKPTAMQTQITITFKAR